MRTCTRTRRVRSRICHSLPSAGVILTTGSAASTLEAANCSVGENGLDAGVYSVKCVLPFLGDRCVQVKPVEQKPASATLNANTSQHPAVLSGDPR